ncbi:MAG: DNA-directed RNA polymerase subunit alpha [Epsilonproteobacteria bacterium]|nr:DNA-directed RNA polymerase subunit alpha [Campylobacterota bacterium]
MIRGIVLPNGIERVPETETDSFGRFVIEPLERGYSITIGNALRRVLLSSIGGYTFTKVKIAGVDSQFSPVNFVKENALDIILNLRNVVFAADVPDIESEIVSIDVKGGVVTAKDIECGNLSVVNKDSYIATAEDSVKLKISGVVEYGVGYKKADLNIANKEPGWIPMDSNFSPVRNVIFHSGKSMIKGFLDYERLEIEITTNGAVTPSDALNGALSIIKQHIDIILGEQVSEERDSLKVENDMVLKREIDELGLSVRAANCLRNAGIVTIGALVERSDSDLLAKKNFGKKSLNEIKDSLAKFDLSLRNEE